MKLLLIRHAQSGNNLLWEQTGSNRDRSPDPGITDLGRRQADAVAQALAAPSGRYPRPTHLYTSLMLRAVQTAAPIAEALDLPLRVEPDIYEDHGPVEHDRSHPGADVEEGTDLPYGERWMPHPGAGRADLAALSPRLVLPDHAGPEGWWTGPVETLDGVRVRAAGVAAWVRETFADDPDAVPALVTHGTFIHHLTAALLDIGAMSGWFMVNNTAVSAFTPSPAPFGPGFLAHWVNRVDHLDADQVTH